MTLMTVLVDLRREECEELLRSATVGRLGVILRGRPQIVPVNHVYDERFGGVAFPVFPSTELMDAALDWPSSAFEVDGTSADGTGWSVLVVGPAERICDGDEIARLSRLRTTPWVNPDAAEWFRIVPEQITGRRIWATGA